MLCIYTILTQCRRILDCHFKSLLIIAITSLLQEASTLSMNLYKMIDRCSTYKTPYVTFV